MIITKSNNTISLKYQKDTLSYLQNKVYSAKVIEEWDIVLSEKQKVSVNQYIHKLLDQTSYGEFCDNAWKVYTVSLLTGDLKIIYNDYYQSW